MFRPKRVAIIGGSGQMGAWFSKFFRRHGSEVVIYSRNAARCRRAAKRLGVSCAKSAADAVNGADLVVISVAVQNVEGSIKGLGRLLKDGQHVIDITSVKQMPVRAMHRYMRNASVLGTHPMFGPAAEPRGQNFILTPTNAAERRFASELGSYLKRYGFNVIIMTPQSHDRMISRVLSLTHFVGFVTADTWKELQMHKMIGMGSTSFRFLKSFVSSIVESSPELYAYLQVNVPDAYDGEQLFARKSAKWASLVKERNGRELQRRMASLRSYMRRLG